MAARLYHKHNDDLRYYDAYEHAERIYRRVCHGGTVALDGFVGVAQRHWIGHGSAEQSADGAEVELLCLQRYSTYYEQRNYSQHQSYAHPEQSLGAYHRSQKVLSGNKSEAGKIQRQSELAQHERCRTCGITYKMYARAECADDDAHDDRASGNA